MCLLKTNKLNTGILFLLLAASSGFSLLGQAEPYLKGRAEMEHGRYESARLQLEKALKADAGNAEIYYQLGIADYREQLYGNARDAFYEAEKRAAGLGSFYLAKCEVKLGHNEQALKYLRIHLESEYKRTEAEILLDPELSQLDNHPGWSRLWNEKEWYTEQDKRFQEALFQKEHGNYLDAINLLNQLEKEKYQASKVLQEKGGIYRELGNTKAALSSYKTALKRNPRNTEALAMLCLLQMETGNTDEALTGLNRLIKQDPALFEFYPLRASAKDLNGNLPGALRDMDLYLTYFPESDSAYYLKGMIEFRNGKYLDAISTLHTAIKLNQGKASYYYARGASYARTGTLRHAERDLSMALDLSPLDGETWFEKGKVAVKMGKKDEACHCYKKAFQYGIYEARDWLEQNCR